MRHLYNFIQFQHLNESIEVEKIEPEKYSNETVTSLPFSGQVKDDKEKFLKKLTYISKQLGAKPEWFMLVMQQESGFNPQATNSNGGATGLIQFMPSTIKQYAINGKALSTDDLRKMSAIDQLDVVYAYYKAGMKSAGLTNFTIPGDFFAITFYPNLVKMDDSYTFPDRVIEDNKGLFAKIGGTTKKDYYAYYDKFVKDPANIENAVKQMGNVKITGTMPPDQLGIFDDMLKQLGDKVVSAVVGSSPLG